MGIPACSRRGTIALMLLASLLAVAFAAPSRAAMRSPVTAATPIRIMPLGDSITMGVTTGFPGGYTPGGYRSPLDNLLGEAGISHTFVGTLTANSSPTLKVRDELHHDGHPGYRVDQIDTDLNGVAGGPSDNGGHWLTGTADHHALYPDVVVIHLGTNDIWRWYDPGVKYPDGLVNYSDPSQRARFLADLSDRLKTLVDKLYTLRPYTRVVLSNIVPMETNSFEPVSHDYSYFVNKVVGQEQALGRRIVFADVYHQFVHVVQGRTILYPGLLSAGGIHPTAAGYHVMADVYDRAIQQVLQAP